jgi:hypothetical protein
VYFHCNGENKTKLPDVKEAHMLYTFKGEESWQVSHAVDVVLKIGPQLLTNCVSTKLHIEYCAILAAISRASRKEMQAVWFV